MLQGILRDTDDHELGPSAAHFFNCFFGNSQVVSGKISGTNFARRSHKKVLNSLEKTHANTAVIC